MSLESVKTFFPNLYSKSKQQLSNAFNAISVSEADYLINTDNTDKDLINLLTSNFEIEKTLGLKFLLAFIMNNKDTSKFTPRIIDLFIKNNLFIKKVCLYIIDYLALAKKYELILIFNAINKVSIYLKPLNS